MLEWLRGQEILLWWMGAFSVLTFVISLIVIPMAVARIPTDYFIRDRRYINNPEVPLTVPRLWRLVVKNLLGIVFVLAGVAMLVFPGQGVLTILMGLMLMNFPGKHAFEQRLVQQPSVLRVINWMRAKVHRPPLEVPGAELATAKKS
jgi:hypothetical protein